MILLEPFTISPLRDVILRTVIKAEAHEDIGSRHGIQVLHGSRDRGQKKKRQ